MPARTRRPKAPGHNRPYDVVIFGASGFAGRLTAAYLARHAPRECRWALAGRSEAKLSAVRAELETVDPALATLPLLTADVTNPDSLRAVAESTRVLATTVGPYVLYGDGLVAACAAAGTDYLDLTGEPEFVATSFVRHHGTALATGARIVHAAGFDSIPHDLGAYFTVRQLPEDVPLTVRGYVRASAGMSGGTFHSAVTAFSRPRQNLAAARARQLPALPGRSVHAGPGRPGRVPVGHGWALPFPSLDPQVIAASARADERYGPDFRYAHHVVVPKLAMALALPAGVAALGVAAQIPPVRRAVLKRLEPGAGPTIEQRERSWFSVTFVGEGGGRRVVTRVAGGDPGYDETAKMLAESALCLAFDPLPPTAGQVTTATAMGQTLIDRLVAAGMTFTLL